MPAAPRSSPSAPLVLAVDDEEPIRTLYAEALPPEFAVITGQDGREALRLFAHHRPAIVLLDITMPELDGLQTLRRIREMSSAPVIMVTAYGDDPHVVRALDGGADDYIVKPIRTVQLTARLRAALRAAAKAQPEETPAPLSFDDGRLIVDVGRRLVIVDGRELLLGATEYRLLELFAQHPGRVLTHDQILERVWGPEYHGERGYVKTYVNLLRTKIERDPKRPIYLLSRRGIGYLFDPQRARRATAARRAPGTAEKTA